MRQTYVQRLLAVLLFPFFSLMIPGKVHAQCTGIVLGGYMCNPVTTFTTTTQMMAGASSSSCIHLSFSVNSGTSCAGWKLKVRAASAGFSNGIASMPVQYASIQYASSTGGPAAPASGMNTGNIALSTTDQTIVANAAAAISAPPDYYFEQLFNFNIQGGNHLLLNANGTYATDLIFSLYNSSNVLVSTATMTASFQYNYSGPNLQDKCSDITLSGLINSPLVQYTTYPQLMAGSTAAQAINVIYSLVSGGSNCPNWSLRVRAVNPSFTNSTSSIPVSYFSLRFNSVSSGPTASDIGVTYNPVQLSTAEMPLISNSAARLVAPPTTSAQHRFDVLIQGGAHLIQPVSGSFTNTLVFSFYDGNNQLVSSWTTPVSIQIYYNANSSTLLLQNGANDASFVMSSPSAVSGGQSISRPNGLSVTAYNNYQIFAQTTNANLVSATTSSVLPVSVIQLESTLSAAISGVSCHTITLSSNNLQPLITNTNPAYPNQIVQYNLRYFINPNNTYVQSAPAATYTGTLVFVSVPL